MQPEEELDPRSLVVTIDAESIALIIVRAVDATIREVERRIGVIDPAVTAAAREVGKAEAVEILDAAIGVVASLRSSAAVDGVTIKVANR